MGIPAVKGSMAKKAQFNGPVLRKGCFLYDIFWHDMVVNQAAAGIAGSAEFTLLLVCNIVSRSNLSFN